MLTYICLSYIIFPFCMCFVWWFDEYYLEPGTSKREDAGFLCKAWLASPFSLLVFIVIYGGDLLSSLIRIENILDNIVFAFVKMPDIGMTDEEILDRARELQDKAAKEIQEIGEELDLP